MTDNEPLLFRTPRRAPRYSFGGAAELMDESGHILVAMVRTLSLYGCFIRTDKVLHVGAKISMKITDAGSQFAAKARVANQGTNGLGIEFTDMSQADKAQLEAGLTQLAARDEILHFVP